MTAHGDDLACQQTCHVPQTVMTPVVVTVPMILGEQQPLPSYFLTQKAGATSKMATWQPTMDQQQQQHVMYMNNRQG